MPLKTLLLNPPSFENFDGGASSRWPATREIESYWYPVWLAYPAGLLEGSRLLDAPPHHISAGETIEIAILPLTYLRTNLHALKAGAPVNLEADVMIKLAVARMAETAEKPEPDLTEAWLVASGY